MKKFQSWGVALYNRDGSHHYWFHNARKETTLRELKQWRDGVNGAILAPTFTRAILIERMTDTRADVTSLLKA
jgi:hypothetical protein